MATVADLNVRIGVLYKDLDDGLRGVERSLQRSGRRLSALGSELTLAISAPLALLGGAAIKSAGNLESLELALESQLGSAQAARKELELLRQEALKPGLGFEQAVRGSVSLQAVGFEAEKSRKILSEFGNALALAGKGKAELDGVVLALTQIKAKGIVSAEEINQIAERLPQIRTLMLQAFGTASTEAIQKLGITADQFIQGITSQMEGLPRAAGGIKNSLENLGDATTNFLANIGKEIARVFDLEKNAERLSAALSDLSDWFMNLSDTTKQWIVAVGAGLVAIGPLVKVFGVLQSTAAEVISFFRGGIESLKNFGAAALNAAKWFGALNTAMKLTVIGAAIAAITALYLVVDNLTGSLSTAEKAQLAVSKASQAAEDSITAERVKAEQLVKVLKDETSTREEKKKALAALQAISPKYFDGLDLEKSKISDIDAALGAYINSLRRAAKARAAFEQIVELEKQLNNAAEAAEPSFWQKAGNSLLAYGNSSAYASLQAETLKGNAEKLRAEIEAQIKALEGVVAENSDVAEATGAAAASTDKYSGSVGAAAKKTDEYAKALASIRAVVDKGEVLGADVVAEQAAEIERQIERLLEKGFRPASKEIQHLKSMLVGLFEGFKTPELPTIPTLNLIPDSLASIEVSVKGTDEIKALTAAAAEWNRAVGESKTSSEEALAIFQQWQQGAIVGTTALEQMSQAFAKNNEAITYWQTQAGDAITTFGASIASSLEDGALSMQSFAQATIAATGQILGAILKQFVANLLLKSALFSKNPLVALAVAGVAGSIGTALFKKTIGAAALAKGGVIDEPTLALVGEYSGAKANPEIVTPENKMREVFAGVLSGFVSAGLPSMAPASIAIPSGIGSPSGGLSAGQSYKDLVFPEIITYLKGTDIAIAFDKATRSRGRAK